MVVGGGPGGAVLALLLARRGVDVTLLEAHADFDREFRGDTLHPSVMEVMDQLGLADRLLELRHTRLHRITLQTASEPFTPVDFGRLKTRFPYVTLMPQKSFLEFVTGEARRYPNFRLVMGARVRELAEEGGAVRGVRYEKSGETYEVRAPLTVGADGRGSRVRKLSGFEPAKTSPPMDVLWFRLPREPDDPEGVMGRLGRGRVAILLDRSDHWQVGLVIPKGTHPELRAAGVESLQRSFAGIVPELSDRVQSLESWREVSLLSVESSRCRRWHRPGLLLIGDAAHVMSPVGGVGINYAIQDAVVAANVLSEPLLDGRVRNRQLAAVQRRRELPTRAIQAWQALIQTRILAPALNERPFDPPKLLRRLLRLPPVQYLPARVIGYGLLPPKVKG